ncbi:MAG: hypothetical protein FJ288_19110, partial [Planctomycetes bacterium]|nr:hypothetical protein [Planctomycetota bacterium]
MDRRTFLKSSLAVAGLSAGAAQAAETRTDRAPGDRRLLNVHACQANNRSPYLLVRAKFRPGEVADARAVKFFAPDGTEVAHSVWDSVTWRVARDGRPDWGGRYALLQHGSGNAQEAREARGKKLEAAKQQLPRLGAELAAEDEAAQRHGDSICSAIYLLRHALLPYGKEKLRLEILPSAPVTERGKPEGKPSETRSGELRLLNLPDAIAVVWKGKTLFRYAGFEAGDASGTHAHADPARPFTVRVEEGQVTKVAIAGQTQGRQQGAMDWQCTYWLFPDGCYVALEGFSIGNAAGYRGGEQKVSIWQADGDVEPVHEPQWTAPWWLHKVGSAGFVATHLWHDTPLVAGYGNNPFTTNTDAAKHGPDVQVAGRQVALRWHFSLDDPAVVRLFAPDGNPQWTPKTDWLYRQYAVGVGQTAPEAEAALRAVIGAAAGWIDRPCEEEEQAALMVHIQSRKEPRPGVTWELPLWVASAVLNPDEAKTADLLRGQRRQPNMGIPERTENFIQQLRANVARGGNPLHARNPQLAAQGIPCEGWFDNPAYHACKMPAYVRFLEHFDLPHDQRKDREAILRYADYSLEHIGGGPPDIEKLRAAWLSFWPNRTVMLLPLLLEAQTITGDAKYGRIAAALFDDLMAMVDANPHGYPSAWEYRPRKPQLFDSVYNPVGYLRGVTSFWSNGYLDLIGREKAARF